MRITTEYIIADGRLIEIELNLDDDREATAYFNYWYYVSGLFGDDETTRNIAKWALETCQANAIDGYKPKIAGHTLENDLETIYEMYDSGVFDDVRVFSVNHLEQDY